MSKLKFYAILCVAVIAASCVKKKYPESSVVGEPVFYFRGNVNDVPTDITAGINKYYMYSSYAADANNVYGFSAELKQEHCSNCVNSIQIKINDYTINSSNLPSRPDSAFYLGYYPYSVGAPGIKYYNVQFAGSFNKYAALSNPWSWSFGDGALSASQYPLHTFRIGRYNTTFTASDTNGCSSTITNPLKFGIPGANCRTSISASSGSVTLVGFNQNTTGGVGGYSYLWNFGDGLTGTSATTSHQYSQPGLYSVSLRAIDNNPLGSDTAIANFNAITAGFPACAANFKAITITPVVNPFRFSNIVIKWIDAQGNEYTSDNSNQPTSSYFQILSTEDYQNNESGQKTKKLHIKFKCVVYCPTSTSQTSLIIDKAETVVTVAVK